MRPHPRRTITDPTHPDVWGTCDRSGFVLNQKNMRWQHRWAGTEVINTRILVAPDMLDALNRQDGSIILPPDPPSIVNARPEQYRMDEEPITTRYTMDGQVRRVFGHGGAYILQRIINSPGLGRAANTTVIPEPIPASVVRPTGWSIKTTPLGNWTDVCYSPSLNRVVAVGNISDPDHQVMYSDDGGNTWALGTTTGGPVQINGGVCWSPELNLFAMVGTAQASGPDVMTSSDGITWTQPSGGNTGFMSLEDVAWSPALHMFVGVDLFGPNTLTSSDGLTWIQNASVLPFSGADDIIWSPEKALFVVVAANNTTNDVATSTNGTSWTNQTNPASLWDSVCWSPSLSLFAAASFAGTGQDVMTSSTGTSGWTLQTTLNDGQSWNDIEWSDYYSVFMAVGVGASDNITDTMYSVDGQTWTPLAITANNGQSWGAVCYASGPKKFVAVSNGGGSSTERAMVSIP